MTETQETKEQIQRALNRAYFYLKFRPRTKKEVSTYLQKKADRFHWPAAVIDQAILSLEEQNLINDANFVDWFVSERSVTKKKGVYALKSELQRYGIAKDLIDLYFAEHELPEEELAYQALQTRWYRFRSLPSDERYQKAAAFLGRRGFPFSIIKKTISKIQAS